MNILKKILIIPLILLGQSVLAMECNKKKAEDSKVTLSTVDQELLAAAASANEEAISKALKAGANVNVQDEQGKTALHKATIALSSSVACALFERPQIIKLLMPAGADCTIEDNAHVSLLNALAQPFKQISQIIKIAPTVLQNMHCTAVMANDPQESLNSITSKAVYAVLDNKDNEEVQKQYYSLITDAWCAGCDTSDGICPKRGTIYGLIRHFGDEDKRMEKVLAAFQEKHQKEVQQAIGVSLTPALYPLIFECLYCRPQAGVMTSYCYDLLTMPLTTSVRIQDVFLKLKRFWQIGGDVINTQCKDKKTALHLAVKQGNIGIVQWIESLRNTAYNPDPENVKELYQLACHHGHRKIADYYSRQMETHIIMAIGKRDNTTSLKNLTTATCLLPLSSDVMKYSLSNIEQRKRYNLQASTEKEEFEIIKILCKAGVDIDTPYNLPYNPYSLSGNRTQTCLEYAVDLDLHDVVKLFLYLGVDCKHANPQTKLVPWQQTTNESMQQLLQFPKEMSVHLTPDQLQEFADIKAERERSLKAQAALYPKAPL